jgi:tetratricopeptide (TPR) repeat protein
VATVDKYEYKVRAEEIRTLIQENRYKEAVEIADSIDWKNVKNSMMLCTVSDLYKACKRYEDSRDVLLLAYERNPGGRMILYSLCELSIKLNDVVNAIEYYKEFQQVAPKDSGRYILKYKLFTMQEVGLEERIEVLEELQRQECKEKWMYELAYLYHMIGYGEKCVEECNQIAIYFGAGKYVVKALELKASHEPLTEEQEALYKRLTEPDTELVQGVDISKYSTIDLQKELANNLKEVLFDDGTGYSVTDGLVTTVYENDDTAAETPDEPAAEPEPSVSEPAAEANESVSEEISPEPEEASPTADSQPAFEPVHEEPVSPSQMHEIHLEAEPAREPVVTKAEPSVSEGETRIFDRNDIREIKAATEPSAQRTEEKISETILPKSDPLNIHSVRVDSNKNPAIKFPNFDDLMSLEGDGQISLVVPEQEMLEKQITGQISIEDVLHEWELVKKENERKWQADVRRRVMEQTHSMFTDFDATSKNGLLEELEEAVTEAPTVELTAEEVNALRNAENPEALNIDVEEPEVTEMLEDDIPAEPDNTETPETEETVKEETKEEAPAPEINNDVHEIVMEEPVKEAPFEEKVIELSPEISSHAPEPAADDNTTILPNISDIDYLMQFAAAGEARDIADREAIENREAEKIEETKEALSREEIEEQAAALVEEALEESGESEEEPEETPEKPAEDRAENAEPEISEDDNKPEEIPEPEEEPAEVEEPAEEEPEAVEEPSEEEFEAVEEPAPSVDGFTEEQVERFESFMQKQSGIDQLKEALSKLSMDANRGNAIIGSDDNDSAVELAKAFILEISSKENITGKVAKIKASTLNAKDALEMLTLLYDGAIVIQDANELRAETIDAIIRATRVPGKRLFIALTLNRRHKHKFIMENTGLMDSFDISFDIEAPTNAELVAFAKKYAYAKEYAIDEMGMLALHTRIDERQTNSHSVMISEVKEIVNEAIVHASKKNVGHFFNVLMGKRYDANDMVVLREKDFTSNKP